MFRKFWAFWLTLAVVVTPQATVAQTIEELWKQGSAAHSAGNYAQASLEELFRQAEEARRLGNYAQAETIWRRIIQLDPNNAPAYFGLGNRLRDQHRLDEAITAYRKAIQLDSQYDLAYVGLGNALREQGKFTDAVQAYKRAIELKPEEAGIYNNLGNVFYDQGNLREAEQSYRRALELDPEFALAHNNLGLVFYDQGKLREAEQSYGRALSLPDEKATPASTHTLAHNALGYTLQQQGNLQAAIAEYNKAIQLDPNYTTAQNNLREAERLLAQQRTPPPPSDLANVPSPDDEPLVYEMRSTVRIIIAESTAPGALGADSGTGWIFKREGETIWIMTNRHVLQPHGANRPSDTIEVEFFSTLGYNQRLRYPGTLVHITPPNDPLDLAVIKVEGIREDDKTIRPLKLHSGYIPRAQPVTIIGHPNNLADSWNVVTGNVTNVNLNSHRMTLDANLASGNSGGPILNAETKEVIGIVVSLTTSQDIQTDPNIATPDIPANAIATRGFGFGHPIDSVVEQLRRWRVIN
ncbi:tetratricopeptide repeat protein [Roseofilum sp. BLCC_M91]|uniref:Tetratricopeptide repeat protein n=1 Tax=Roseofilum halophilum BLCC-M91 TaxID=3022259 RepID=A0ABT7BM36_9CYAN|nr:tetratricopeptide repeat protein [Roseofilum halophilum]MDJ1179827.1 tetratricopeptide repeat protein [Roseofilum halophilum BLCC-M91]